MKGAARQNSDSYLATENVAAETPDEAKANAEEGMEEMSRRYNEGGDLYVPKGD